MMEYKLEVNFIRGYKGWRMKAVWTVEGPYRESDDSLELSSHRHDPYSTTHLPGDSLSLPCVQLFATTDAEIIE